MADERNDVIIIGGGIAGSGLAALLAAGGLDVTVLERTEQFQDRVRGEMYAPWGVDIARRCGLLEPLLDAGATFTTRWVFYDPAFPAEVAEELAVDVSTIVDGVPGILNFTHPAACQALYDHAARAGATMQRGVGRVDLDVSSGRPEVTWTQPDGSVRVERPSLVVGADGRASGVRRAAGIELHSVPVRQYITGLLVEGDAPLASHIDCHGTTGEVNWYNFPQGPNRSRVYLAHFDVHRYSGPDGTKRFLSDLSRCSSPNVAGLSTGRPLTPLATHPSVDTWTERPYAEGVVLVGDAGGYNDPIIGQGLSLTMADVRDVSGIVLAGGRWPVDFARYGWARNDRLAKLRLTSQTMAEMMCSFDEAAAGRRLRGLPLLGTDATVSLLAAALFAGPEVLPPGTEMLEAASKVLLSA